jgi:hypothetical protein
MDWILPGFGDFAADYLSGGVAKLWVNEILDMSLIIREQLLM